MYHNWVWKARHTRERHSCGIPNEAYVIYSIRNQKEVSFADGVWENFLLWQTSSWYLQDYFKMVKYHQTQHLRSVLWDMLSCVLGWSSWRWYEQFILLPPSLKCWDYRCIYLHVWLVLCGTRNWTQGFTHARQTFYQLSRPLCNLCK